MPAGLPMAPDADGASVDVAPEVSYDAPSPDSPLYLTPKPVR